MSEPTTGEIVESLRGMLSQFERIDYAELVGAGSVFCGHRSVWSDPDAYKIELAINRLESQERELSEKTEQLEYTNRQYDLAVADVEKLTALAEQAERERDTAVAEKERILNLRASENTDNKYLYML